MKINLLGISFAITLLTFAAPSQKSAQTKKFTSADLQKLHWIDGERTFADFQRFHPGR